jgi:T3SS (YopN, CesT) and YbjN peptide-binding chaperone 1
MNDAKVRQQSLAILENNGLTWSQAGEDYSLRFASAQLLLGFTALGAQTLITLRAPVLHNVLLAGNTAAIHATLNELNCASHFGKWALYENENLIALEYDLLGDHLQEDELMTALTALARLADQQDDLLQQKFGGNRSFESA